MLGHDRENFKDSPTEYLDNVSRLIGYSCFEVVGVLSCFSYNVHKSKQSRGLGRGVTIPDIIYDGRAFPENGFARNGRNLVHLGGC